MLHERVFIISSSKTSLCHPQNLGTGTTGSMPCLMQRWPGQIYSEELTGEALSLILD